MTDADLVRIATVSPSEAAVIVGILQANGIQAITQQGRSGKKVLFGDLSGDVMHVSVAPDRKEEAEKLLREAHEAGDALGDNGGDQPES